MGRDPEKAVLVAFCARDGDPYQRDRVTGDYVDADRENPANWGPILRLLALRQSGLYGRVSHVYYLCHPVEAARATRKHGRSDLAVARDSEEALKRHISLEHRPFFERVMWRTDKPPNSHRDIFDFVRTTLRDVRGKHPDSEIVLQLSSGTSAMHAVLLIAGSVGIIRGPVRLIQSERDDGALRRPNAPFADVDFELPTVLQLARETIATERGEDAAPEFSYDDARSDALRRAVAALTRAAPLRFPLLLRGERGVGKSSLAKLVRAASPFRRAERNHAWPSIACGQYADPTLLYVELCGAIRGSYTGLQRDRDGLLKLADGDTLFLDEVHDLDHRCQRAVIRVIEEGRYSRLGEGAKTLRSRFRLISGTNLPDHALETRLSPDFLDRIRDVEIVVPPLRDCREDLPLMWRAMCANIVHEARLSPNALQAHDREILAILSRHALPGNWRDLRRLAARLTVELSADEQNARERVESVLREFERNGSADGARMDVDAISEPRLSNRHAVKHFQKLEVALGSGLEHFWQQCGRGNAPAVVLHELLGNRHSARHAAAFIRKTYPNRWRTVTARGTRAAAVNGA